MGNYFSNLHIKTNEKTNLAEAEAVITEYFASVGAVPAEQDGDFEVTVCVPDSGGYMSVYCDRFVPSDVMALSPVMSERFETDVLSIACFDSDYLFLNLVNVSEAADAWLNIGKSYEISPPRRTNMAAWRKRVSDFELFKAAAKQKYICAEDFLQTAEKSLGLPYEQAVDIGECAKSRKLYFSAPIAEDIPPTKLVIDRFELTPCQPGKISACFVSNKGAASKGIAVLFRGNYVEHEDITIDDAEFSYHDSHGNWVNIPISWKKIKLNNGEWAYFWEDEKFKIQPRVSESLPPNVQADKEYLRSFGVRYTPHGDRRKFLDIAVTFVPLSNALAGQCTWRVWGRHSSKREYIEQHNESWARFSNDYKLSSSNMMLDPNDYDMD